jgi:dTDP-L-rhamnose 4-epimerase
MSIYAIGKRDHEEMFITWGSAYGVPATAVRCFNVYGPRQSLSNPYTGVAAIFATRLLNGRPPLVFEDGLQSRDFVHVADVVRAITSALEPSRGDYQAINVGTGVAVTVFDVAKALAMSLGLDLAPHVTGQARAGDVRHCFADIALAARLLDFQPQVPFTQGVTELAAYLEGRAADDQVDIATAALAARGLAF